MFDQWDTFADYIPQIREREPERVDSPPVQSYAFDGHLSPSDAVRSTPAKSIPSWDESSRTLNIVVHRHPVTPAFLRSAFDEARKNHGSIRKVAVYVQRGLGDSQSIAVLRSMNFAKNEGRTSLAGQVCYVRDMKSPKPKPEVKPQPKPEPKEPDWLERELQIVTDAIDSRRALGVHETFLTGLLSEQADLQKQVDAQDAARESPSPEMLELIRQEGEVARQIQELSCGGRKA